MLRYTGASASGVEVHQSYAGPPADDSASLTSDLSARIPSQTSANVEDRGKSLIAKLSTFIPLGAAETEALRSLTRNICGVSADQVIIHEGIKSDHVFLVVEGLACRYKMLPSGRRQILGYLIPGDMCDAHYMVFNRPDHGMAALCDSKVAKIPIARIAEIVAKYPQLATAFAYSALVDTAILREWLLSVGQRQAEQRLAHLICEIGARLKMVHRVMADGSFDLPINQATLADTIGLTLVHTNRIVQRLRQAGLISLRQRRVTILDRPRLLALAGFDENYLHLDGHKV